MRENTVSPRLQALLGYKLTEYNLEKVKQHVLNQLNPRKQKP
jgi:hypothetical protein